MGTLLLNSTAFTGALKVDSLEAKAKPSEAEDVDIQLVERTKQGDITAFKLLVERYQGRAHAIALGVVRDYQDAEDIAQEAFLKAYKNLSSFRGQSSFYTWFYRIVFNLSIDLSRKAYRRSEKNTEDMAALDAAACHSSSGSDEYMATVERPDEYLDRTEIRAKFKQALGELSPAHRAVIVLREIDGLSYEEISRVVGCSKGTVMSRLHHARKRLQKALEEFKGQKGGSSNEEQVQSIGLSGVKESRR